MFPQAILFYMFGHKVPGVGSGGMCRFHMQLIFSLSMYIGNYSEGFDKVSIKQKIPRGIENQAARVTARVAPAGLHVRRCTVQGFNYI